MTSLEQLLQERILIIDGAMGTMIQARSLEEKDFRGERFRDHPKDLKGNNDLLCLTQPQVVEAIHREYLDAGADIVETNTFTSTSVSLERLRPRSTWPTRSTGPGREAARRAVDAVRAAEPGRSAFVAGAMGPTNRSAAQSTDVADPAARNVTFDDLVAAYHEQARGLLDGGVDLLLVETAFDTLNLKAALFAVQRLFDERGVPVPLLASGTIVDMSGRTMTGQTVEAFWNSISHAPLLSVGINCALGPAADEAVHRGAVGRRTRLPELLPQRGAARIRCSPPASRRGRRTWRPCSATSRRTAG